MNRDPFRLLAPLLALAVFGLVCAQTLEALQASGVWHIGARKAWIPPADPLAALDGLVARVHEASFAGAGRDPFGYVSVAPRPQPSGPVVRRPVVPPPPELPVLTAIVYDSDPRALVRWQGREYTVRGGGLFDEFLVERIARDHVVLKRGSESVVLRRKPQGE